MQKETHPHDKTFIFKTTLKSK